MKKYYPILKTTEETEVFLSNFSKYKEAFSKIVEQVNIKAMRASVEEKEAFISILRNEIQKLSGTINATLSYSKNHADDNLAPLAQNPTALDNLKNAKTDVANLEKAVEFAISQAETTSIFHDLARGIIPQDYATFSISDIPVDSGSLEDSPES